MRRPSLSAAFLLQLLPLVLQGVGALVAARLLRQQLPLRVALGHLFLLADLALGLCALGALLPERFRRPLQALAGAGLCLFVALCYAFDILCRHAWGDQGNLALALRFHQELPRLLSALGPLAWAAAGTLGTWLVLAAFIHASAPRAPWSRRRAALLLLFSLSLLFAACDDAASSRSRWDQDPILGLLDSDDSLIPLTPPRLHALVQDSELRRAPLARTGRSGHRNLILVIVDAERPDHLSAYGYPRATTPFLDREKAAGRLRVVRDAFSNGPVSAAGIMGILTSRDSHSLSPRLYGLGELMWRAGRTVRVFTTGDDQWYGLSDIYGPWASSYVAGTRQDALDRCDDRVVLHGLRALAPSDGAPSFFFIHLMTVHEMGVIDPAYQVFQPAQPLDLFHGFFHTQYSEAQRRGLLNNLDGRILQADRVLQDCFAELGRKGYLQDAVAVITADHGQLYGEHGDYGHSDGRLWDPSLRIPLMVWGAPPPKLGRQRSASTLDVAPSLAEWAGVVPPPSWQGIPLSQPERPRVLAQEHVTTAFGRGAITLLDGHGGVLKYLAQRVGEGPLQERAFQVDRDHAEADDLFTALSPTVRAQLRDLARARLDPGLRIPPGD